MTERVRRAGVLLPISALPSAQGIGCFSDEAYRFVDMLADGGQRVWQILPLCPTSLGDSPYQSPCSFGGNPYFISLQALVVEGLLDWGDLEDGPQEGNIDYGYIYSSRYPLLRKAYGRFCERPKTEAYGAFLAENCLWVEDMALFMAIKESLGGAPLWEFPAELREREPSALAQKRQELSFEIGFWRFLQFKFFEQWRALRAYANSRGISIMGDIPIYVSADSADVWTSPRLFELDSRGAPLTVAGCPPDGFSPKGQLWGNPVYNWNEHKKDGFAWWKARISHAFSMYDIVRIDHFRGFEAYYSVPASAADATDGYWRRALGEELFSEIKKTSGQGEIIAEDLGYMTEGVQALLSHCGFSGMKILQFGFDGGDMDFSSDHLPCNYPEKSVAYTGTHDNPTLVQWLDGLSANGEAMLRRYVLDSVTDKSALADKLIALAMQSPSELCVIPMQDYLGIGKEGRMNTPAAAFGNWSWRMRAEDISEKNAKRLRDFAEISGRAPN